MTQKERSKLIYINKDKRKSKSTNEIQKDICENEEMLLINLINQTYEIQTKKLERK